MKKWIAAAVALIWLLSCAGLAESVAGPVALEDRSLLIALTIPAAKAMS
ncbi:MAG: hypothetical protein ACLVJ6_15830 [Merdibacter sp.]